MYVRVCGVSVYVRVCDPSAIEIHASNFLFHY